MNLLYLQEMKKISNSRVRKLGLDEKKFEIYEADLSNLEENFKFISELKKISKVYYGSLVKLECIK